VKRLLSLVVVVLFGACTPDVEKVPAPSVVVAEFEPGASVPVVPLPNDLAKDPTTGKIVVPPSPTDTPAQKEFNTQYLGTLEGFPFESTASVRFTGPLDPASVNPQSVIGLDITAAPAPVPLAPVFDPAGQAIVVPPPAGGWTRAHRYAIAVVAGPNGVRSTDGRPVVGSATWALVTSPTPIVTCADLTAPDCRPTVDIIPSTQSDLAARLADQRQKAIQLEQLRRGLAPLLDGLAATGIDRASVVVLWTFTIVDAGAITFDPANNVVPFPNDALLVNGKVNLPNPKTGAPLQPADCQNPTDPQIQLTCGLNTLDGFSTIAPPISESSDTLGALEQGTIDPASLNPQSVALVPVASTAPEAERTQPKFTPCVGCLSSPDAAGNPPSAPQQLQWRLDAPLDEKTTYLGFVTNGVKDDQGKPVIATPAFALLRSSSPLVEGGHSTVNVLSDAQAMALEPLRAALKPALDQLEASGVPRANLALAFAFTTQSEATLLDQLYALPAKVPDLPAAPLFLVDATAQYTAAAGAAGIPIDHISRFLTGTFITPVAITGPGGTLDPNAPKPEPVDLLVTIPDTPPPEGGYPITIFGHGFTRTRDDIVPIANSLAAAGQVAISSDTLFHGERTSCTGSKAATGQPTDDAACADPTSQRCNEDPIAGRCVAANDADRDACTPGAAGDASCGAAGQGRCVVADAKCEGGDFARDAAGRPVISGWNIFNLTNLFATRDNLRQPVIDLSQLVRVIKSPGASGLAGLAGVPFDTTKMGYVGQSLGGILGTSFNAVSPDTTNVVLNVAGGVLPEIILTAPSFAQQRAALLAGLAAQEIMPGTPAFDRFIGAAQWVIDPADPANMGWRLTHPTDAGGGVTAPNPNRKAFLQFIEGDQTVPNLSNLALVMAANRSFVATPPSFGCASPLFCYEFTEQLDDFSPTTATPPTRHGFLLVPPEGSRGPALTTKAQTQVPTFLVTGALP
jgi:hypothetical protein